MHKLPFYLKLKKNVVLHSLSEDFQLRGLTAYIIKMHTYVYKRKVNNNRIRRQGGNSAYVQGGGGAGGMGQDGRKNGDTFWQRDLIATGEQ